MNEYPPIRTRPPIVQRTFRGENKLDQFSINDDFSTESNNLTSSTFPGASTRPGYAILGTFGTKIIGMGVYKETELHVIANDGSWRRLNSDGSWTVLVASGLDVSAEWTFTNAKLNLSEINLIATNGTTPQKYNGTSVSALSGVPAGAKYITQYADRLWAVVGNELKYSAYREVDDWVTVNNDEADSGFINIESSDGETVNSIQAGLSRLTITKPSSVHVLSGYSPSDYSMRVATLDTGQLSQKAGVTLDGWLYQLYDKGFYKYPGSGFPESGFSERIRSYFDDLNQSGKAASSMGTDGRKLYFCIPVNSAIPDTLVEYDPTRDTYYNWSGINALFFAQVQNKTYIGDASGRVLSLGDSMSDGGVAIPWKWVSKPFTGISMAQNMRWMRLYVTLDLPVGSTFNVYLSKSPSGDSDWIQAGATLNGSGVIVRRTINFPSNILPPSPNIRVKFEGTGPMTIYEWAREEQQFPLR